MNGARPSSFVIRGRHTWRPYDGNGTPVGAMPPSPPNRRGDAPIAPHPHDDKHPRGT